MRNGHGRPQEVAGYIGEMCAELREMAHGAGLSFLSHLLSMVILQAQKQQQADGHFHRASETAHSND